MPTIGDVRKVVQSVSQSKTFGTAPEAWRLGFKYRVQAFEIAVMEDLKLTLLEVSKLKDEISLMQKGERAFSRLTAFLQRK